MALLLALSTLLLAPLLALAFYRLYLHPLSAFPGSRHIASLHDRYASPVVRVGPNELSFGVDCGEDVAREIGRMPKAEAYKAFDFEGFSSVFSERDVKAHFARLRLVSPLFSRRTLLSSLHLLTPPLTHLLNTLPTFRSPNILPALRRLSIASVSAYTLSRPYTGDFEPVIDSIDRSVPLGVYSAHAHGWAEKVRRWRLGLSARGREELRREDEAWGAFGRYVEEVVDEGLKDRGEEKGEDKLDYVRELAKSGISRAALITEVSDMLYAGTNSTALTLSLTLHALYSHPSTLQTLLAALLPHMPSRTALYPLSTLEAIPYLSACAREGLRISSPVPRRLQRCVPSSPSPAFTFRGAPIPPGTTVGISPFEQHRRGFAEPLEFRPERWLADSSSEQAEDGHFWAFGKGARACAGRNLAMAELLLVLAQVVRRFEGDVPEGKQGEVQILDCFNAVVEGVEVRLWERGE